MNLSRSTIQRILKDNRQHAYHYTRVQNLMPQDYPARLNFCRWLLQQVDNNENFVMNIMFTDESLSAFSFSIYVHSISSTPILYSAISLFSISHF
ncbi:hypothetical protein BDFB_014539 [Asbolus verrucosus]|uniref:Uncharacterized protein n=1 Tax=Asbolus verrucosus TaxID=1661398 RepID=A0A482VTM9_ASBVE|nr:hypothetical protein BDFB_014539 [Asbolus verrucosus]